jgi:hypothetical protein
MGEQVKIVVTVPESEADDLRKAIGIAGAGEVGNYSFDSFSVKGIGRFLPEPGAEPTIGKVGNLEMIIEERIEINCNKAILAKVIKAIRETHSYEEPTIDVYPLIDYSTDDI